MHSPAWAWPDEGTVRRDDFREPTRPREDLTVYGLAESPTAQSPRVQEVTCVQPLVAGWLVNRGGKQQYASGVFETQEYGHTTDGIVFKQNAHFRLGGVESVPSQRSPSRPQRKLTDLTIHRVVRCPPTRSAEPLVDSSCAPR